jgi:thioredoxin 1
LRSTATITGEDATTALPKGIPFLLTCGNKVKVPYDPAPRFAVLPKRQSDARPQYHTLREESMSEHIHHITDTTFKNEVLESGVPVLVDYWAEWCGPCKMIAPILDEIAKEYTGKLKVAKINIDDNQKTPGEYGVRGIPTLMLFKGGNVEATKVGALSKSQLTAFIDSNL